MTRELERRVRLPRRVVGAARDPVHDRPEGMHRDACGRKSGESRPANPRGRSPFTPGESEQRHGQGEAFEWGPVGVEPIAAREAADPNLDSDVGNARQRRGPHPPRRNSPCGAAARQQQEQRWRHDKHATLGRHEGANESQPRTQRRRAQMPAPCRGSRQRRVHAPQTAWLYSTQDPQSDRRPDADEQRSNASLPDRAGDAEHHSDDTEVRPDENREPSRNSGRQPLSIRVAQQRQQHGRLCRAVGPQLFGRDRPGTGRQGQQRGRRQQLVGAAQRGNTTRTRAR